MIMIRLFKLLYSKSLEDMTQNTIITEHKAISFASVRFRSDYRVTASTRQNISLKLHVLTTKTGLASMDEALTQALQFSTFKS